jgi:heat shock protein beta|tara:strand:+ start:1128 stop:9239 length:8112 start_codon:yes stop_codon:yes gene_type:complete
MSMIIIVLMLTSTMLAIVQDFSSQETSQPVVFREGDRITQTAPVQTSGQVGQGSWNGAQDVWQLDDHPVLSDIMWADPGVASGIIADESAIAALMPYFAPLLEESNKDDHDNDGVSDLYDLDDDNDGIYDLLERFDGCYGTDPFDHDNDGISDAEDWDDDNDGILEGPIDIEALEALGLDPLNVSTDRRLDPSIIHPWTGQAVGPYYLADQNPMDHDNDGVTDEDSDGSGPGSYDEDDDNDARIDQFKWPCDLDSDGIQDYFDDDDDGDGVNDIDDIHPYNASLTTSMSSSSNLYDTAVTWDFNSYRQYSGGINFLNEELNRVNAPGNTSSGWTNLPTDPAGDGPNGVPAFTTIVDGDLDGDGIPNFIDPDNDNDETPDSADTDDDNDGILDMVDPDDDNDGIPDVCVNVDFNGDNKGDYDNSVLNGVATGLDASSLVSGQNYIAANGVGTSSIEGVGLTVDITVNANGEILSAVLASGGYGYSVGDDVSIIGGNSGGAIIVSSVSTVDFHVPGQDSDNDGVIDCEMDYDQDLDDDRLRPFDQNYNGVYDWLDPDMGGTPNPDNLGDISVSGDANNFEYDLDDDQIDNENDSFPLNKSSEVATWNCPTTSNPNPVSPDPRCNTQRASYSQFNDWDGDGINNWEDVDDDNDGIIDALDIDWDCDLDNDGDLHAINGALYRDDGPNSVDSDIDGDGLVNDIDWDDDNDGISDFYDPDDGNCGVVDYDANDNFGTPYYPVADGGDLDGSQDSTPYTNNATDHWNLVFWHNPFANVVLDYNGYDATTTPVTPGTVPEYYWFLFARWSPYNGGNDWDIDGDGDSLTNGLDIDQDADGLPDWWDQDEGNDGLLDVNDPKMGGSIDMTSCGWTAGQSASGYVCGYQYAFAYHMPLNGVNAQFGSPYSIRPDAFINQGATSGGASGNWSCTPGAQGGCWHYDFASDGTVEAGITYTQMKNNRDAFVTWFGLESGIWQWTSDNGPVADFPDELGADLLKNDVDGDIDGDFTNATIDLDNDYDSVYDWYDVDDDNNGLWDFFEVDTDDDYDNDANQDNGNFFSGLNCEDNDDDGNDADVDSDGFFQAVWDRGILSQGFIEPSVYDVDNDNDAVPDAEDPDDDNNGILDVDQELLPNCFFGEEQSPFDNDNDGIVDWADDDWDGDGLSNTVELAISLTRAFDHDNDGERDDIDTDDDEDGMLDEDEVMLWPSRFDRNSTNPWDHDDFGNGEGLANPLDPGTGPDAVDNDDDNDSYVDVDFDHLEEGETSFPCYGGAESSDWDSDNNCILDEDDKAPTYISLNLPDTLWIDAQSPSIFSGHVDWVNPVSGQFEPAVGLPVQVHIEWADNGTTALETIDVLTSSTGNFSVGQFLYPEDLTVGDNTTYRVYAVVTEMFAFNGNESTSYYLGAEANLTADIYMDGYFRSDEQPFWIDMWSYYTADIQRGIFDNFIPKAPFTFSVRGGVFGNYTHPTNFTGLGGNGYRAGSNGLVSVTFIQDIGINGIWKQIQWNSTRDNGVGQIPGGYEEVAWDSQTLELKPLLDSNGDPVRYDYTNTSLPAGDYEVTAVVQPDLASDGPFPYLHGDETEPQAIRVMHRMNIEGQMIVDGINPVYWYNSSINNGDGTFGNWATLFHSEALTGAGLDFADISKPKPYPKNWNGDPLTLNAEEIQLRNFISTNSTHWFINLVNGGDSDLPPCGAVDLTDPNSPVRCEIVPEMNTGDTLFVIGSVTNRTNDPWDADPIALQVDIDGNGQFLGSTETAYTQRPTKACASCAAEFDYNWTWFQQYASGTYGMRVDFTNSAYYFTGNGTNLAPTGAYINVTVVGTTDFQTTSVPRLYRNTSTTIQAKLVDNSLQPVRNVPVNYTWSADGRTGVNYTDDNGFFEIPFNITANDNLGDFTLQFEFAGTPLLKGNTMVQQVWVVSRTYLSIDSTSPNIRQTGDIWDFTALVNDDNTTSVRDSGGSALDGALAPNGGLVDVIFEGVDFSGVTHRQIVATVRPTAGTITLPEPAADASHLCYYDGNGDGFADRDLNQDGILDRIESSGTFNGKTGCLKADISPLNAESLRNDPESFLPDGFGPVNVILRFEENLPNEGCAPLDPVSLGIQGAWDPCLSLPGNDHFRLKMTNNANGFSFIGRTSLTVDDQIVYTSEISPITGEVIPKPMTVTGQLQDELGTNLTNRNIRVNYEMINSQSSPTACNSGMTDMDGYFSIQCPLSDVSAGKAKVTVTYSAYDNNDAYRYQNDTYETEFDVFSNSTLALLEVGPFKSSVETWTAPNTTEYPVLYLKESFHIDAKLMQSNGQYVGGKCLNIYLDPEQNIRPISSIRTSDIDGTVEWFSGDRTQNPKGDGVETTGGKLEGFRTLRIAFEPDVNVPGGCDKESSNVLNGSYVDQLVLVRSRIDLQVIQTWSHSGDNGLDNDDPVFGSVALQRDRLDLKVENEEIWFIRQYWSDELNEWVREGTNKSRTNEQGVADFEWAFAGQTCDGVPCSGQWRIIAYYPGSTYFEESQTNVTHEIIWMEARTINSDVGFFTPAKTMSFVLIAMSLLIAGAIYYQRAQARRQVQALRGILTDTMMQLEASNEFIAAIFDCYKNLVKYFKRYGFMKKVYETTREFETAVRSAFSMVPSEQLDDFLSVFEEARYSDHTIDASHKERALRTLDGITRSLTVSLGEGGMVERKELVNLYDKQTKAGEFVAADGTVRQAGIVEGEGTDFKI